MSYFYNYFYGTIVSAIVLAFLSLGISTFIIFLPLYFYLFLCSVKKWWLLFYYAYTFSHLKRRKIRLRRC